MTITPMEIFAAAAGVFGCLLLALNGKRAGWGFVLFLASNAGWIAFAIDKGHGGLLAQQLVFTCTSVLGIWTWLLKPAIERRVKAVLDFEESIHG